jgi:hypothetical protein
LEDGIEVLEYDAGAGDREVFGGYGRAELEVAGAYQVDDDPADLLRRLDEVGERRPG